MRDGAFDGEGKRRGVAPFRLWPTGGGQPGKGACDASMATINKVAKTDPLTTVAVKDNDKNIKDWLKTAEERAHGHATKGKCVKEGGCSE